MTAPYTPPEFKKSAFNCPRCGAYAGQTFYEMLWRSPFSELTFTEEELLFKSLCAHCGEAAFWFQGRLFDPPSGNAPAAHPDMPANVRADYDEAKTIVEPSPRGAAALLRLAIQKLMPHLGEPGKDLNADIASLVRKGMPQQIQQALDFVRVVGNESVRPPCRRRLGSLKFWWFVAQERKYPTPGGYMHQGTVGVHQPRGEPIYWPVG